MTIARSKVTSQGQISIPAEIRKRLGLGPGSVLEWAEGGDAIVVRKAGRSSFADIRQALFPDGKRPTAKTDAELKEGIRQHIRRKHARD